MDLSSAHAQTYFNRKLVGCQPLLGIKAITISGQSIGQNAHLPVFWMIRNKMEFEICEFIAAA
ncbi:hypothetical protein S1OALGB6SA_302 [Olavius algarvensis spirochete endosymbiont]|nr:hypothetical protein S1OALGB6SA_302 [Olavius algarvensis spirochete endosymbiont]